MSPDQSRREFKKGGGSTLPDPGKMVRTEKCLQCSVTTYPWCPWGEQFRGSCVAGSLESICLWCE